MGFGKVGGGTGHDSLLDHLKDKSEMAITEWDAAAPCHVFLSATQSHPFCFHIHTILKRSATILPLDWSENPVKPDQVKRQIKSLLTQAHSNNKKKASNIIY